MYHQNQSCHWRHHCCPRDMHLQLLNPCNASEGRRQQLP
uniref:Uncharacterized protein n=1 Tax=Brassica campestris TaxID=3711 RepID=A0A3P6A7Y2_BRACM|nr:unnamed protein product [Brassica rapa]